MMAKLFQGIADLFKTKAKSFKLESRSLGFINDEYFIKAVGNGEVNT